MIESIRHFLLWFTWETGMLGQLREYSSWKDPILLVLAVVLCFLGFGIYRLLFSGLTFMLTALTFIYFIGDSSDWGSVTTGFSVVGSALAFLAFRWVHLGAIVVNSFLMWGLLMGRVSENLVVLVLGVLLISLFTYYFPVQVTIFMTALAGGILLGEIFLLDRFIVMGLVLSAGGFQYVMNRKQTLFEQVYPVWLNNFRKKKGVIEDA